MVPTRLSERVISKHRLAEDSMHNFAVSPYVVRNQSEDLKSSSVSAVFRSCNRIECGCILRSLAIVIFLRFPCTLRVLVPLQSNLTSKSNLKRQLPPF